MVALKAAGRYPTLTGQSKKFAKASYVGWCARPAHESRPHGLGRPACAACSPAARPCAQARAEHLQRRRDGLHRAELRVGAVAVGRPVADVGALDAARGGGERHVVHGQGHGQGQASTRHRQG